LTLIVIPAIYGLVYGWRVADKGHQPSEDTKAAV